MQENDGFVPDDGFVSDDGFVAHEPPGPGNSPVTAATTGALNGATLNWAPSIGAAGQTAMNAITGVGSLDDLVEDYQRNRDKLRSDFAKAAAAHPHVALAGNLIGGGATLAGMGPAAMTTKGLAGTGATMALGNTDINSAADLPKAALNAGEGAAMNVAGGKVAEAAAPFVGKALAPVGRALSAGAEGIANAFGNRAEDLAVKATGATGAQSAKFADETGRELLDRGIVKFGSSPADIAANANSAMDAAEASKSEIINNQLNGTSVDRNTVYNYIRNKINALSGDESQLSLVNKLESKLEDITGVAEKSGSEVPLAKSEEIRRGFDTSAKWDKATDAVDAEANKITANAYREAGENAANEANPELGAAFKSQKDTQHLLIPVAEAAEKRAATLNQSPHGGLLDIAAAGSGGTIGTMIGGPVGGVIGASVGYGVKALRPRYASMGAVTADQISNIVRSSPQAFGKFAGVLQNAAARGSAGLGATDYILQQTNQEYRDQRNKVFSPEEEDDGQRILATGGAERVQARDPGSTR